MHLIYVNEIGSDYKGQKQYEFVFSESTEIDMGDWFAIPASSCQRSKSPDVEYVDVVGLLKDTDLQLELIQNSDFFGVIDAVDGVISLAWEKFDFDYLVKNSSWGALDGMMENHLKSGFMCNPLLSRYVDNGWSGTHGLGDPSHEFYRKFENSFIDLLEKDQIEYFFSNVDANSPHFSFFSIPALRTNRRHKLL